MTFAASDHEPGVGSGVWPWGKRHCAVWGFARVRFGRGGPTKYQLVVFAPKMDVGESGWVYGLDRWFTWGFATWMFAVLSLKGAFGVWPALAITTVVFVVVTMLLERRSRPTRRQARILTVSCDASFDDASIRDRYAVLIDSAAALQDADHRLERGAIGPAEHELIRSAVYDRLPVKVTSPSSRSR